MACCLTLVTLVGMLVAWRLKLEPELVLVCLMLAAWSLRLDACGPDPAHARTHRRELLS